MSGADNLNRKTKESDFGGRKNQTDDDSANSIKGSGGEIGEKIDETGFEGEKTGFKTWSNEVEMKFFEFKRDKYDCKDGRKDVKKWDIEELIVLLNKENSKKKRDGFHENETNSHDVDNFETAEEKIKEKYGEKNSKIRGESKKEVLM